ncbi:unnamed protein product, partial [Closterium sp. NIES-65]
MGSGDGDGSVAAAEGAGSGETLGAGGADAASVGGGGAGTAVHPAAAALQALALASLPPPSVVPSIAAPLVSEATAALASLTAVSAESVASSESPTSQSPPSQSLPAQSQPSQSPPSHLAADVVADVAGDVARIGGIPSEPLLGAPWSPNGRKYLLALCSTGGMSNHLFCLREFALMAGALNRTLVVPMGPHELTLPLSLVFDMPFLRACYGPKTALTLDEYKQFVGRGSMKVTHVLCLVKGCHLVPDAGEWGAQRGEWQQVGEKGLHWGARAAHRWRSETSQNPLPRPPLHATLGQQQHQWGSLWRARGASAWQTQGGIFRRVLRQQSPLTHLLPHPHSSLFYHTPLSLPFPLPSSSSPPSYPFPHHPSRAPPPGSSTTHGGQFKASKGRISLANVTVPAVEQWAWSGLPDKHSLQGGQCWAGLQCCMLGWAGAVCVGLVYGAVWRPTLGLPAMVERSVPVLCADEGLKSRNAPFLKVYSRVPNGVLMIGEFKKQPITDSIFFRMLSPMDLPFLLPPPPGKQRGRAKPAKVVPRETCLVSPAIRPPEPLIAAARHIVQLNLLNGQFLAVQFRRGDFKDYCQKK